MEYEELTLEEYNNAEPEGTEEIRSDFGCCDKYKKCSLAGRCLEPDETGKSCAYKKHLDAGEIFYSKNASNFSQERYDHICDWYNSLGQNEKQVFLEIVSLFIYLRRSAHSVVCGNRSHYYLQPDYAENFQTVYNSIKDCKVFSAANPSRLVKVLREKKVLSVHKCDNFCERYSDIPFETKDIDLPKELDFTGDDYKPGEKKTIANLNAKGKLKHEKQLNFKLKKWEDFVIQSGTTVLNCFPDFFIYIEKSSDFTLELEEWAEDHYSAMPKNIKDFKYLIYETTDQEGEKGVSFAKMNCFAASKHTII